MQSAVAELVEDYEPAPLNCGRIIRCRGVQAHTAVSHRDKCRPNDPLIEQHDVRADDVSRISRPAASAAKFDRTSHVEIEPAAVEGLIDRESRRVHAGGSEQIHELITQA